MSRALVISGGGSKGAFAVGVLKNLLSKFPLLDFDIIVGTSTGSLIAPLAALNQIDLLEELYKTQTSDSIVLQKRLGDRLGDVSIFDANPLWSLVLHYFNDQCYGDVLASGKKLFLTTTCLQTGELTVFTTTANPFQPEHYEVRTLTNPDHFRKAVMASACQPVFMQPIKVNKNVLDEPNPHFQFVDGGVREYAGIQMAIDNGATEIFTILLSPAGKETEPKELTDLFSILRRSIDIFTDDVGKNDLIIPKLYNDALVYIDAVKKKMAMDGVSNDTIKEYFEIRGLDNPFENKTALKMYIIRPTEPLNGGPGGLTFDPVVMEDMINKGQTAADDFIAGIPAGDITWA
jgi:NTE family protein